MVRTSLFICFVVVLCRFFYWQVIQSSTLNRLYFRQLLKPSLILPKRGQIYDRHSFPLAVNYPISQVSLYKPDIDLNQSQVTEVLQSVGNSLSTSDQVLITQFFQKPQQKWITLSHTFPAILPDSFNKKGIISENILTRYYPEASTTAQLLGSIPSHLGIETFYHKLLSGQSGYIWQTKDAQGKPLITNRPWIIPATDGKDLRLTIDRQIQSLAYEKIKEGVTKYQADSGSIIISQPQDGSIIAIASYSASPSASLLNPAIGRLFEPGSIFKPLIVAMSLETGSIDSDYICTQCALPLTVNDYTITNWDSEVHPNSSLKDIIKNSDNIGMSHLIRQLGLNNFLVYYKQLGLNQKTSIDLPGEAKPLTKNNWSEIDLATASFGQGFAVTQIKMLQLFNLLTSSSPLVKPHLAVNSKAVINKTAVFNPKTISEIKEILQYATENGAVNKLKPHSLEVCGKSGTAQIAVKGGYTDSATTASYIGFSPCSQPRFSMIITIDNPRASPWGSSTAAPIWFDIAESLDYLL